MSARRNKNEIIYDILEALVQRRGRLKPTRLLYKANLSHSQMKEYMGELEERGLVRMVEVKKRSYYELTEQGYEFFQKLHQIKEMSDALGL